VIGASGAVSGILGAYCVLFPFHPVRVLALVIPLKVPAFVFIGLWVATQWMMKQAVDDGQQVGVAVWAHLGGFAAGFAATLLARLGGRLKAPPRRG
jgi:membrane associated rhomboid family serine protease